MNKIIESARTGGGVAGGVSSPNSVRNITVFGLTVWAYKTHMVQYEVDRHADYLPDANRGNLLDELLGMSRSYDGRGCINGAGTSASVAAHVVHAHVKRLSSRVQILLIKAGSEGKPPNWDPIVPPSRVTPVWIGPTGSITRNSDELWDVTVNGRLRLLYGVTRKGRKSHEPNGCAIGYAGTPAAIAEAIIEEARSDYLAWWAGLDQLAPVLGIDPRLAGFRITGNGAPELPWNRPSGAGKTGA